MEFHSWRSSGVRLWSKRLNFSSKNFCRSLSPDRRSRRLRYIAGQGVLHRESEAWSAEQRSRSPPDLPAGGPGPLASRRRPGRGRFSEMSTENTSDVSSLRRRGLPLSCAPAGISSSLCSVSDRSRRGTGAAEAASPGGMSPSPAAHGFLPVSPAAARTRPPVSPESSGDRLRRRCRRYPRPAGFPSPPV